MIQKVGKKLSEESSISEKKKRQTKKVMGREYQRMDGPVIESDSNPGKRQNGNEIIDIVLCAPTDLKT